MKALVIVDMLEDFVHGALANPRAQDVLPPLRELLAYARREGWVRVFANDAHQAGDPELAIWGEHAMAGTPGAQVVSELAPELGPDELIVPKRAYGAFDGTDLAERLRARGVGEVVLAGQHTHICIRHTAYGAFGRSYRITVPRDAVCAFEGVDEEEALEYLRTVYGARVTTVGELLGHPVSALAGNVAAAPLGAGYDGGAVLEHEP
jgi:nicotinamidase-related amidase